MIPIEEKVCSLLERGMISLFLLTGGKNHSGRWLFGSRKNWNINDIFASNHHLASFCFPRNAVLRTHWNGHDANKTRTKPAPGCTGTCPSTSESTSTTTTSATTNHRQQQGHTNVPCLRREAAAETETLRSPEQKEAGFRNQWRRNTASRKHSRRSRSRNFRPTWATWMRWMTKKALR